MLLPACVLAGASSLLGADIIARLALSAAELPIGVVTATAGSAGLHLATAEIRAFAISGGLAQPLSLRQGGELGFTSL
ncbi:vtamin B12-transporter permease [Raoultella planticola]|uniref:Vtamin B12-transporter permease n=1 Tax=Raoultella planticola TaxID=575 RepID=A0A485AKT7_RAOPL|nr:vtamin B12-transporter permease [Raoultella planticola]